jgi:hypothetical protein
MAPIPEYAWPGDRFFYTNTSNMGTRGVLLQIWKGQQHAKAYDSKTPIQA